jgi:hypothetical protein
LPVYSRAKLWRTIAIAVALFLTAVSTSAVARPIHDGVQPIHRLASIAAMAEIDAGTQRGPAAARLVDRIRKVE